MGRHPKRQWERSKWEEWQLSEEWRQLLWQQWEEWQWWEWKRAQKMKHIVCNQTPPKKDKQRGRLSTSSRDSERSKESDDSTQLPQAQDEQSEMSADESDDTFESEEQHELKKAKQDLQSANEQLEKEQMRNKAMEEELSSLRKALQDTKEEAKEDNQRAHRSAESVLELEQQLEKEKQCIHLLNEEMRVQQEQWLQLQKEASEELGRRDECVKRWQAQLDAKETQLKGFRQDMQSDLEKEQMQNKEAEKEIARRDVLIEVLQDLLEAAEEERNTLGSFLDVSSQHATELENNLAWHQVELKKSWQGLRNANMHMDHQQMWNQDLEVKAECQNWFINALQDRLNTSSQDLHIAQVQVESEQMQNKAMEEELSSLRKALNEAKQKAKEDLTRLNNLQQELHNANMQVKLVQKRNQVLQMQDSCQDGDTLSSIEQRFSFGSRNISSCSPIQVLPDQMRDQHRRFLPDEFLPLLFEFLPVAEVAEMEIRAVSSFFASPKVWVAHLVKLMDVDSVLEYERANTKNPVLEYVEYQQSAFWDNSGRKPSLELKREGSERFQGYRIWMNGLFKWHAYNPDISFHVVKVVTGWFASQTTGLDRLLGKKMCEELLCDGLRDLRLEIANGLLPVLSANRSCFKTCKTVTRFLQACNCAFPFLSKSFVLKLVEILTSWSLNDETWRDLKAQLREQIMRITDVILPTDQALLASRCINKIGMAEEDSEGGIEDVFAIHGQKLKALLMES